MNKTLVITHKDCFDGHTAAWIYSRFVDRDAEFVSARYGDPVPNCRGRAVIIADFSWNRASMFGIACDAERLVVLDHHKTAQDALDGLARQVLVEAGKEIVVVFDMERSGAGIMWDYYPGREPSAFVAKRPDLVNYVEARDLWRLDSLPNTREYMAHVYAAPMTFEAWDDLHSRSVNEMVSRGEAILGYMHQYGTKGLAEARRRSIQFTDASGLIQTHYPWTVNMPYMNCSDYLSRLMEEKGTDFVMGYFCRNDGRWQFSLRSRNGFDCSVIAKAFGGGGHKEASGFDIANLVEVFT